MNELARLFADTIRDNQEEVRDEESRLLSQLPKIPCMTIMGK